MNKIKHSITPHPNFLETLFAYKSPVSAVFKDVLGLNDLHHIALSYIHNQQILTLSSTPSLEFNLFSSPLWQFDRTYHSSWYSLGTPSAWQSLYAPAQYDALYYLKQIKHHYPTGLSMAIKSMDSYIIYSIASHNDDALVENELTDFYKIGAYCSKALLPLLIKI